MSRAQPGRKPLILGNWKMHFSHFEALALVQKLAFTLTDKDFDAADVAVLPPFTVAAQRADPDRGRQAAARLRRAGRLRRTTRAPTPATCPAGCWPSSAAGTCWPGTRSGGSTTARTTRWSAPRWPRRCATSIAPVLCVGETLEVRQAGEHVSHTLAQLDGALAGMTAGQLGSLVVAYEPVWAIGTGEVATPAGRPGDVRRHPQPDFRRSHRRAGRWYAYSVWGFSEARQHGCDHGAAGHRWRAGRRREPRCRRFRQDLPVS